VNENNLPILLSRKQVAQYTGISIKTVEQRLANLGVQPIDIGGNHYALKWHREAVSQALWNLQCQGQHKTPQKTTSAHPVLALSIAELDALIKSKD